MRRFLFIPLLAMLALAATVLPASAAKTGGATYAQCSVADPNSVPVGGSVTFSATGLTGKNFLGVSENASNGGFTGVMQQVIPLTGSDPVVSVTLPSGPSGYTLVVYNGSGTYSDNHFECWAFANTY